MSPRTVQGTLQYACSLIQLLSGCIGFLPDTHHLSLAYLLTEVQTLVLERWWGAKLPFKVPNRLAVCQCLARPQLTR